MTRERFEKDSPRLQQGHSFFKSTRLRRSEGSVENVSG